MPKMRMGTPASPTVHTKRYSAFKGVDFSSDPTQVDDSRSPRAVNVYPDATGCPQKRPGWAALLYSSNTGNDSIRGIYRFKTTEEKAAENTVKTPAMDVLVIHAGNSIYSIDVIYDVTEIPTPNEIGAGAVNPYVALSDYDDHATLLMEGLNGDKSTGFMHDDKLYILTGKEFVVVKCRKNGSEWILAAEDVSDYGNSYIPLTYKNCYVHYYPSNDIITDDVFSKIQMEKQGEFQNSANIVTAYRKNTYTFYVNSDDHGKDFILLKLEGNVPTDAYEETQEDVNNLKAIKIEVGNKTFSADEKITAGGVDYRIFDFPTNNNIVRRHLLRINRAQFRRCLINKYIIEDSQTPPEITINLIYPAAPTEEKPDLYTRISKCHVADWYNSRLFVSGNPDYPNADFYSQVGEPTYFPDINYTEIGSSDSRIMGYLTVGNQQAVIKSESMQLQDSSVYLRRAEWDSEEGYYYPLQSGIVGTGAVSEKAIMSFVDDPIFLTRDGVMAIVTENITGERVLVQRSTRINKRLLSEPNIETAVMTVWDGYLLIAINGHVYLADSRQRTYARNSTNTFEYEWYYWDDICFIRKADRQLEADEITCFAEYNGTLYFGTKKGNICTFRDGDRKFMDLSPLGVSKIRVEKSVNAEWSTKLDDDGSFTLQKNLCRRGCGIFLKGVKNGKVKILVRTDKEFDEDMQLVDKNLSARSYSELNFEEFDFDNLSFKNKTCMVAAPNRRVKKYAALQIICRSDTNSDFGLLGIEKRYTIGRYEK